ncbi:MAG: sodium-dependent transporter [Lachnospiraceae bacterium]|jgi:NSS family neurotransmitter:Na+ symporter|nr:sodium-dependent transporter [Lachnospiraceae bacterium]
MTKPTPTDQPSHSGKPRSSFSGKMGYVLAVAGSAVGLGNIWRFPYLAAKYGGGIFLLVYLVLMLTFGYALIVSETALGRMTKKSPVGAFRSFGKSLPFRFGGWVNAVIPMLIVPYYCVIGGWVTKYLFEYISGNAVTLAEDAYFSGFISSGAIVEFWLVMFTFFIFLVIVAGVKQGVERVSKIMMPVLVILAIFVSLYSITRPGAMEGVKYLLIPNLDNFSWMTVVAAMGQMFYSLSIAMGILYTYGSYLKKEVDIEKSTSQVEIFDTAIAVLAGLMIIPAVFAFSGGSPDTLQAGPSLMFITIPKVFANMEMGDGVGILFFLLVLFAALTSAISLTETSVSTFEDQFGWSRRKCSLLMAVIILVLGSASALGFSSLDFVTLLGMSILDFFDFLTNSIMMPLAALATCFLITRVVGLDAIAREVEQSSAFRRKKLYFFFMKYLAPVCIGIILVSSIANAFGWISM